MYQRLMLRKENGQTKLKGMVELSSLYLKRHREDCKSRKCNHILSLTILAYNNGRASTYLGMCTHMGAADKTNKE